MVAESHKFGWLPPPTGSRIVQAAEAAAEDV